MPEHWSGSVAFRLPANPAIQMPQFVQVGDHSGNWILVPAKYTDDFRWLPQVVIDALNLQDLSLKLAPALAKELSR